MLVSKFQNSATRTSSPGAAFVLEVPLRNLLLYLTVLPDRAMGPLFFLSIKIVHSYTRDYLKN